MAEAPREGRAGTELTPALPPGARTWGRGRSWFAVVVGALYLLNPTAGWDLIPDIFPIVGNLDEAGAAALLLFGLRCLGYDVGPQAPPRPRKETE